MSNDIGRPTVLIISAFYPPAELGGGPARTLEAMVRATRGPAKLLVLTSAADLGGKELPSITPDSWTERDGIAVRYSSAKKPIAWSRELWASRKYKPDVIYLNSLFDALRSTLPLLAHRLKFWPHSKVALAPRGELDPGALAIKRTKKQVYIAATKALGLTSDVWWHASTEQEAKHIRACYPRARIIVHENETLLPSEPDPPKHPARGLAYVSRITRKKGLDVLLRAMQRVSKPAHLDVYGNAEDQEFLQECQALASNLPPHVTVTWHGPLPHGAVRETLGAHVLLVLPTLGENFGHIIAEALSVSCPVMIPPTTPWSAAASATDTLVPDRTPGSWTAALDTFLNLTPSKKFDRRRAAAAAYRQWADARPRTGSALDTLNGAIQATGSKPRRTANRPPTSSVRRTGN